MYNRFYKGAVTAASVIMLSACAQSTRHSNTMLFGTNTHLGIRAGASAGSVPELSVGYTRQEAVIMPLVANSEDNGTVQKPCDATKPVTVNGEPDKFPVHPCLLVGLNGGAQDSYSVLASFGTKYSASAGGSGPEAGGQLAQYFATGVAAQMLAIKGGASVVALGEAAKEASSQDASSDAAIASLFGDKALYERSLVVRNDYDSFKAELLEKVKATPATDLKQRIQTFEETTGTASAGIEPQCPTVDECANFISNNMPYSHVYEDRKDRFRAALDAWGQAPGQ